MNRDDLRALIGAAIFAVVLVVAAAALAHADDVHPKRPALFTCWTVKRALALYSEADLIAMARAAGISEAEIERAKRCVR